MCAYVQWLAPRLDDVRHELVTLTQEHRIKLGGAHPRTTDALAQVYAAWKIWLRFAAETGAATAAEAAEAEGAVLATLRSLAREQQALQQENDPVERFLELLGGVLGSGRGHVTCASHPDRPPNAGDARAFGWRRDHGGTWHPQGPCVGWSASDGLFLEPSAAYAATRQFGSSSDEGVGIAPATLWKRMHERGLLLTVESAGGELRLKCRKSIGGVRRRVVHIAHLDQTGPTGPSDKIGEPSHEVA
jgi:hypothetical protein